MAATVILISNLGVLFYLFLMQAYGKYVSIAFFFFMW